MESTAPVQGHANARGLDSKNGLASTDRMSSKISKIDNLTFEGDFKPQISSASNRPLRKDGADVWVKKWVDYSSKYGLGYLLSNNATGVFFNDATKIILDQNGTNFDYIERKNADKQDVMTSHTLTDYPKELQKKITLLQHFKSYLEGNSKGDQVL